MRPWRRTASLALVVALTQAAWAAPLRRLTFAPHWQAQAEFAGYYVAAARGIYARRGLDVQILSVAADHAASQLLADGRADVVSLWLTTAIRSRDRGVPLVNVAQLLGRSSLMLVAKKSSGIREPSDLQGRKIGVWDGDFLLQPLAFFQSHGVRADLVPLGSTINLFLRGGVDATLATWFNEYHTILDTGVEPDELTTFFFSENGVNFPEDGLYCRADALDADPSACRDFVRASLEGWDYAFANPDEAVALVMQRMIEAHVGTNAAHQRWMLERMRDLMRPANAEKASAVLRGEDYDRVAQALAVSGWIERVTPFSEFARRLESP